MQVPKAPKKPVKPRTPEKIINKSRSVFFDEYEDRRLVDYLEEEFPLLSIADLKIRFQEDGWDNLRACLAYDWSEEDPKYDEKMTKYHKKLEEYEEARRQYKLDVEKYKQKLKEWHEAQLKDLTD